MENIEHKRINVKGEEKDRKYKKDIRKQRNGCGFKARAKKKKKKKKKKRRRKKNCGDAKGATFKGKICFVIK